MSITFGSQTLTNASVFEDDPGVKINEITLLSGKNHIDASKETVFRPTFNCLTEDLSEITYLKSRIGYSTTLIVDSTTYTKCYIKSFKSKEYFPGKYSYTISFTQDTT